MLALFPRRLKEKLKMKSIAVTCTVCLIALAPSSYAQRFATVYTLTGDNPAGLAWAGRALYGTTFANGGTGFNCGTVYRLQPPASVGAPWAGTVLYSFPEGIDEPCSPAGAPVVGAAGTLYGTTSVGGLYILGVSYSLQPPSSAGGAWTESVLYDFGNPATNIGYSESGLVSGPAGSFYVLTSESNLCQLQPPASPGGAWTATVLYTFPFGLPGGPLDSLAAGPNGILYGTSAGGPGAVFMFIPPAAPGGAWSAALIHHFGGPGVAVDNPIALTITASGTIYGTAYGYDPPIGSGDSAIFQLIPPAELGGEWTYTNLVVRVNTEHFNTPVLISNGKLYGGITNGTEGAIFELQPHPLRAATGL
jgi:uncharacterized repeat protein (TIGR03803 family)